MSSTLTQALGDYLEDYATLNFKFLSINLTTGVPTALLGTPVVSVYKGSSTTQSVAGITLAVEFDSVVGLNNVLIDLSSDAFYAVGQDYSVVLTAGTVNSVPVVGTVLATFSIENRSQQVTNDAVLAGVVTNAAGADVAADIIAMKVDTAATLVDTAVIGAAGVGLTAVKLSASGLTAVNDQVVDVLVTDTHAEIAQGDPAIVASLATMIRTIFKFTINKQETSSTTVSVFNSDESTVDHKSTISEAGGVNTKGEFKTGP